MTKEQITQEVNVQFIGTVVAKGSGVQGLASGELTFTVNDGKITYKVGEQTTITSDVSFEEVEKSGLKVDASGNLYGDKDGLKEVVSFELVGQTSGADAFGNQFKVTIIGDFDAVENFPPQNDNVTEGIHNVQVLIEKI